MSDVLGKANQLVGPKLKWCRCPDCDWPTIISAAHEWWICPGCNETQIVDNAPLPPAILCSSCGEVLQRDADCFRCQCGRVVTA